jgi:hypothetical protein
VDQLGKGRTFPGDRMMVPSKTGATTLVGKVRPMLTVVSDSADRDGSGAARSAASSVIDEIVREGARRMLAEGLDQTLATARRRLTELQVRLARGFTRRDRAKVEAEIAAIRKPRWVADIITVTLTGEQPAELRLTWRTDARARARLEARLFGKRILFTNRDWPVPDIVAAYRSQSDAEFGFRQLKNPHVVSFSPMHHWTDSKIRVHVFYCVLALAVAHLMRRHAAHAGLHMSVRELLDELAGIEENRAALPRRRQGTPARATHAHRHDPHPAAPGRPVRHPPVRADPLNTPTASWVIHPPIPKTPANQAKPAQRSRKAGNSR